MDDTKDVTSLNAARRHLARNGLPLTADAVIPLAGGGGERLPAAMSLVEAGIAPVLVVSEACALDQQAARRLRASSRPFEVIWVRPFPESTRGEARMIRRLAEENRWRRVVVVTSQYHAARARLLIKRCVRQEVVIVSSTPTESVWGWARRLVHECGGLIYALVVDRRC
jgi:uncharacterized SAM-binding protein YcdF (DUF218 family)